MVKHNPMMLALARAISIHILCRLIKATFLVCLGKKCRDIGENIEWN